MQRFSDLQNCTPVLLILSSDQCPTLSWLRDFSTTWRCTLYNNTYIFARIYIIYALHMQNERQSSSGNQFAYCLSFLRAMRYLKSDSDTIKTVQQWCRTYQKAYERKDRSWQRLEAEGKWLAWDAVHVGSFETAARTVRVKRTL